jgi:hypothetical protein
MTVPDPLTQLDALDEALTQGLRTLPTLLSTIAWRYKDAMPGPLGAVALDRLYLDQAPLTHHLCALVLGSPPPAGRVQQVTSEGFVPVSPQQNHWALRFLARTGPDLQRLYLDAIKRFWGFTLLQGQPARLWLRDLCQAQWRAQVQLRLADQTLTADTAQLLRQAAGTGPRPWQGTVVVHHGAYRWAIPGAFVVCRHSPVEQPAEPVVLSTLSLGFETFASVQALYQELAERLEDDRQGPALLAPLSPQVQGAALNGEALTFEPLDSDLFDQLASQLERRQQEAVTHAWPRACALLELRDLDGASDLLRTAADIAPLISSQGLRLTRYVQLLERDMPSWMHNLSQNQRLELILAMRELAVATANAIAPGLPTTRQFADPAWLQHYARTMLITELKALGITVPSERIIVTVTYSDATGPLVSPLHPSSSTAARVPEHTGPSITHSTRARTLIQLALENISPLDFDYLLTAQVRDDRGQPIAGLTGSMARRLVRRADVGGRYGRHLLERLRYGPEAQSRRERHARLLRAKMFIEGLKARFRGQLGPDNRGWAWIKAVLEQPISGARGPVAGINLGVWQVFIRNTPLEGVYLFGPVAEPGATPVLLYASDSPSRKSWHWFDNRRSAAIEWLNAPATREYILQHVALAERSAIDRLLGTPALAAHVEARWVNGSLFDDAYRSETRLVMANADAQSASNREINLQTTTQVAMTLTEIACMFLPGRVAGVFSLTRALWSFAMAWEAMGEEPASTVLLYACEGYANLFEASVALSTSPIFGKLVRELPMSAPVPLHTPYAVKPQRTFLRYRLATDYSEGVYEAQQVEGGASEFFIEDRKGRRYEVMHDGKHWRVIDSRMPQAMYRPIVRKNHLGEWEMVDDIRWQGVTPDIPALLAKFQVSTPPAGVATDKPTSIDGRLYVRIGQYVLAVRPSLLANRYIVILPPAQHLASDLTLLLRQQPEGKWQARIRQSNLSSEWFAL